MYRRFAPLPGEGCAEESLCVDGLRGFPQVIETMFPQAQVQLCIVHLIRNGLNYVTWKGLRR